MATITASVIIVWLLIGLVIGGLARLLVPGRQHIGLILTILIGIVAALLGGIITTAILGAGHTVITFIVALVAAALLVSAFTTRGYGRYRGRGRRRRAGAGGKRPMSHERNRSGQSSPRVVIASVGTSPPVGLRQAAHAVGIRPEGTIVAICPVHYRREGEGRFQRGRWSGDMSQDSGPDGPTPISPTWRGGARRCGRPRRCPAPIPGPCSTPRSPNSTPPSRR